MKYDNLRDAIVVKCKTIRHFCNETNIPYQSLMRNYLKGREDLLLPYLDVISTTLDIDKNVLYQYLKGNGGLEDNDSSDVERQEKAVTV